MKITRTATSQEIERLVVDMWQSGITGYEFVPAEGVDTMEAIDRVFQCYHPQRPKTETAADILEVSFSKIEKI